MAEIKQKRLFVYKKSFWKLWSNSFSLKQRVFCAIFGGLVIVFSGAIHEGYQNGRKIQKRQIWLRDRVNDRTATEFSRLDFEVPSLGPNLQPSSNTQASPPEFISCLSIALGGTISFGAICVAKGDEKFYSQMLMPMTAKYLDPELAHEACVFMTKHRLIRCKNSLTQEQSARLRSNVFNLNFNNPIGVAAGFDKNSHAVSGLSLYGLGFAEIGTVTPRPQDGNPKKRIFRAVEDKALVNRCGFNNKGIDYVVGILSKYESSKPMLIGLNLGKNKDTDHISSDYLIGLEKSQNLQSVDYLVINLSSPNTPGLRDSQNKKNLEKLLDDVLTAMDRMSIKKPLLIKIAPDLTDNDINDIAHVITKKKCGESKVSGIILTNTTITRPNTSDNVYTETGGLSGPPLREMSTRVIREFYRLTKGQIPIIGVGGVSSGRDALDKIKAGASLIQLYTSLTYEGPPVIDKIKRELAALLEAENISTIAEAVGLDHKITK